MERLIKQCQCESYQCKSNNQGRIMNNNTGKRVEVSTPIPIEHCLNRIKNNRTIFEYVKVNVSKA